MCKERGGISSQGNRADWNENSSLLKNQYTSFVDYVKNISSDNDIPLTSLHDRETTTAKSKLLTFVVTMHFIIVHRILCIWNFCYLLHTKYGNSNLLFSNVPKCILVKTNIDKLKYMEMVKN